MHKKELSDSVMNMHMSLMQCAYSEENLKKHEYAANSVASAFFYADMIDLDEKAEYIAQISDIYARKIVQFQELAA